MRLIDFGSRNVLRALAAEEAVLGELDAGRGQPAWLFWSSPVPCAVLGTARPAGRDLHLAELRADGVPVRRRRSGGGSVLLGPGSPVVTLVTDLEGNIRECYRRFCDQLLEALAQLGVEAGFQPPADLAAGGRKLAGLAQRRRRRAALVTASLLAEPLAEQAGRYLAEPAGRDAPPYRAGRAHGEFMSSLAEMGVERPAGAVAGKLKELLAGPRGASPGELTSSERAAAEKIVRELAEPEWIFRL